MDHRMKSRAHLASVGKRQDHGRPSPSAAIALFGVSDKKAKAQLSSAAAVTTEARDPAHLAW